MKTCLWLFVVNIHWILQYYTHPKEMALKYKLETDIEIKAQADKFYNIFRSRMHLIPNVSSDKIQGVQVHEGDWETTGSVKHWNYTLGKRKHNI